MKKIPRSLGGEKLYIADMLAAQRRHISFHTPGHKRSGWDITELSYSDALFSPSGVIGAAQRRLAEELGAASTFLLTDGSTCGVHAMLYALAQGGVQSVAVPYGAHVSVFGGCELAGITPVPFGRKGAPCPQPSPEEAERALADADALLLVSPDYYGFVPDLKGMRAVCDRLAKPLVIDGAHGAHLRFGGLYAGRYADMWVDGAHKSLPAYTQGAAVSAKTALWAERLQEGVRMFHTTSPSYPIMASVEYALRYPQNVAIERAAEAFKREVGAIRNDDWSKVVVPFGEFADAAQTALEKRGIFPEFNDGQYLMFYLSPCTKKGDLVRLKRALAPLPRGEIAAARFGATQEGAEGDTVYLPVGQSAGMVCAKACGLFPPCTPLLYEGEVISESKAAKLAASDNTFGLKEGKILVYKPCENRKD